MKNKRSYLVALLAAIVGTTASAALLTGCGGGGNGGSPTMAGAPGGRGVGVVRFSIQWPTPEQIARRRAASRVIPASAQSIDITVEDTTGKQLAHKLFVRPDTVQDTGTLDITHVPAGTVKVTARAYPNADGTGVLQSQGFVMVTVKPSQTVNANLSMLSTVTHIKILTNTDTLKVGDSELIGAQALDANEQSVMTGPNEWGWGVDTGTYGNAASFVSAGQLATVTAKAPGPYVINAFFTGIDASQASVQTSTTINIIGATSASHILVLDNGNNRIVGLNDITGKGFTILPISGVTLHDPTDMALDSAGNVYLAEYQSSDAHGFYPGRIIELDPNGNLVGTFKPNSAPSLIYIDPQNRIYWRDDSGFINRMDNIHGDNLQSFGGFGALLFGDPIGIATDTNGLIYILDGTGNRVLRVDDMTGANPKYYGTAGNGRDNFDLLDPHTYSGANHGLAIDSDNHVYVADYGNNRIVRFDANALNDPATSNFQAFTIIPNFGGGGANYFFPISVAVTSPSPNRIYFTGIEKASRTGSNGSNDTINAYVVRASAITNGRNDLEYTGGTVGSGDGQFSNPVSIAVK